MNDKIYVGVHKTENPNEFDGYIGNGISPRHMYNVHNPKFPLHYAVQKYGLKNFKRETLAVFEEEEKAYELEAQIVTPEFVNRSDTYNYALGGGRGHAIKGKVYQFDLDGTLIETYECISEASELTGISPSAIATSIRNLKARRGFLWSFDSSIDPSTYYIKRCYKYYIYDDNWNFLEELDSRASLLSKYHLDSSNLSRAIKRKIKVNGYYVTTEKLKRE